MEKMKITSFLNNIAKSFKLVYYPKGTPLFHQGEQGDFMVLVLTGLIECIIAKTSSEQQFDNARLTKAIEGIRSKDMISKKQLLEIVKEDFPAFFYQEIKQAKILDTKTTDIICNWREIGSVLSYEDILMIGLGRNDFSKSNDISNAEDVKYYSNGNFNFKRVFTASVGDIIGEKALESNLVRAATCYASQDSYCLRLTKSEFDTFFQNNTNENSSKKEIFFSDMFNGLTDLKLCNLSYMFDTVKLENGNILVHEGDEITALYLIYSGELEIYKSTSQKLNTSFSGIQDSITSGEKEMIKLKRQESKISELNYKRLGIFKRCAAIGGESVFDKQSRVFCYSARVVSNHAVIYKLWKEDFYNAKLLLGDEKESFIRACKNRDVWVHNRINSSSNFSDIMKSCFSQAMKKLNLDRLKSQKIMFSKSMKYKIDNVPDVPKSEIKRY